MSALAHTAASAKTELRLAMLARRDALSEVEKNKAAEQFTQLFLTKISVQPREVVALYHPIHSEMNVLPLLEMLHARGIMCALPCVTGDMITFRHYTPEDELTQGAFGIMEPLRSAPEVIPTLMVVPLLAFDKHGHRLGYGKGFYDRTMERSRGCQFIGAAYAWQEVDTLPYGPHDVPLDAAVTDQAIISLQSKR